MELNKEALDKAARVNSGYPSERWYEGGTMFRAQMRNNVRPLIEAYLNALPKPAVETPDTQPAKPEPVQRYSLMPINIGGGLRNDDTGAYMMFADHKAKVQALQAEIELLDDLVYKSAYKASKLTRESVTLRNELGEWKAAFQGEYVDAPPPDPKKLAKQHQEILRCVHGWLGGMRSSEDAISEIAKHFGVGVGSSTNGDD